MRCGDDQHDEDAGGHAVGGIERQAIPQQAGADEYHRGVEQERGPFHPNRFLRKPYVASSLNRMENFFMSRVFSRSHVPANS